MLVATRPTVRGLNSTIRNGQNATSLRSNVRTTSQSPINFYTLKYTKKRSPQNQRLRKCRTFT
ncbi:hypothetical protein M3Y94_00049400 [Aphelenchoides besseyi]|nr:hypothetical protein M3Y94_00049400 [Aphelenchoides besseyi]